MVCNGWSDRRRRERRCRERQRDLGEHGMARARRRPGVALDRLARQSRRNRYGGRVDRRALTGACRSVSPWYWPIRSESIGRYPARYQNLDGASTDWISSVRNPVLAGLRHELGWRVRPVAVASSDATSNTAFDF